MFEKNIEHFIFFMCIQDISAARDPS